MLITLFIYLYQRWVIFGFDHTLQTGGYQLNFSPSQLINSWLWYGLWSLGAPETLINYVPSWFSILPRYFADFPQLGVPILGLLLITVMLFLINVLTWIRQLFLTQFFPQLRTVIMVIYGGVWFMVTLLPVIFSPQHKFALELGLPLIGFLLALTTLINSQSKKFLYVFLGVYIGLNFLSTRLTIATHYSVLRSNTSHNVLKKFQQFTVGQLTNNSFLFINDTNDYGQAWGSSKQIKQALMDQHFFQVVYPDKNMAVFYQDDNPMLPTEREIITISTKEMLP